MLIKFCLFFGNGPNDAFCATMTFLTEEPWQPCCYGDLQRKGQRQTHAAYPHPLTMTPPPWRKLGVWNETSELPANLGCQCKGAWFCYQSMMQADLTYSQKGATIVFINLTFQGTFVHWLNIHTDGWQSSAEKAIKQHVLAYSLLLLHSFSIGMMKTPLDALTL